MPNSPHARADRQNEPEVRCSRSPRTEYARHPRAPGVGHWRALQLGFSFNPTGSAGRRGYLNVALGFGLRVTNFMTTLLLAVLLVVHVGSRRCRPPCTGWRWSSSAGWGGAAGFDDCLCSLVDSYVRSVAPRWRERRPSKQSTRSVGRGPTGCRSCWPSWWVRRSVTRSLSRSVSVTSPR